MKYHRKLKRSDLSKYNWRQLLMMAASELSRAASLSPNGGKELRSCLLRAKELFGVLEIDPQIPFAVAIKLLPMIKQMIEPAEAAPKVLYNKAMQLAQHT